MKNPVPSQTSTTKYAYHIFVTEILLVAVKQFLWQIGFTGTC